MSQANILTIPAIRVKVTGRCNRSCSFCHEEGDMKTIGQVTADEDFFACIHGLLSFLGISRVMLTGGEPTIHPQLKEIIRGIQADEISITSNGIRLLSVEQWKELRAEGLSKVTISIHDMDAVQFLNLETRAHNLDWAQRSLDRQIENLRNLAAAGIRTRVNTVVYGDYAATVKVLTSLRELQKEADFEIRLLNDLNHPLASQEIIEGIRVAFQARETKVTQRSGSSNVTRYYRASDGFSFSAKVAFPYFFGSICDGCALKASCFEGFYGVRLEKRGEEYCVRLCIYKQGGDVVLPWRQFLENGLAGNLRSMFVSQASDPSS